MRIYHVKRVPPAKQGGLVMASNLDSSVNVLPAHRLGLIAFFTFTFFLFQFAFEKQMLLLK